MNNNIRYFRNLNRKVFIQLVNFLSAYNTWFISKNLEENPLSIVHTGIQSIITSSSWLEFITDIYIIAVIYIKSRDRNSSSLVTTGI